MIGIDKTNTLWRVAGQNICSQGFEACYQLWYCDKSQPLNQETGWAMPSNHLVTKTLQTLEWCVSRNSY